MLVDGDKSLVIADKPIVSLAKKNMDGIVPLFYNMKKALPSKLNNKTIYKGLNSAFAGSNIGQYSNNITKIWNSDTFVNGNEEQKQEAVDMVKITCMLNNFCIDFAKTLYMPTTPPDIDKKLKSYINNKVPHFFKYAKDREDYQVSNINDSFVNKLNDIIPNPRINCRKINLGDIDYKLLMSNPRIDIDNDACDLLIDKYRELNKKYYNKINFKDDNIDTTKCNTASSLRQGMLYKDIAKEIRSGLLEFGYTEIEITDILVKYLYHIKNSKRKEALWFCYGKYIVDNLIRNVKKPTKDIQCIDCGEWIDISTKANRTCRCIECQKIEQKRLIAERVKKYRKRKNIAV